MEEAGWPTMDKWLNNIEDFCWNRLGLCPREMQSVLATREVRRLKLELLLSQTPRKKRLKKKEKKNILHEN